MLTGRCEAYYKSQPKIWYRNQPMVIFLDAMIAELKLSKKQTYIYDTMSL